MSDVERAPSEAVHPTTVTAQAVRIERLTRNLRTLASAASDAMLPRPGHAPPVAETAAPSVPARPRAAVVSWDLAHNPVGRAYVLYRLLERDYEVDLIGPLWSRYGESLWAPLRSANLNVRSFRADRLEQFVLRSEALIATRRYDLVHVCKPRLPSLYIGAALKRSSGCPLLVDVDDLELSFFEESSEVDLATVSARAREALDEPYEELATRYAQTLVRSADAVTVSNVALRERFGGHIVRHARDEEVFRPCPEARIEARRRLGIGADQFALMFIGTPRIHKGIGEVARALHELGDDRVVLHVVGRGDAALERQIARWPDARIVFHDDCSFEQLPELLAGADLVPLIQNPQHPISRHQIPAKVSDALALGIPVITTDVPPLRDLIAQGAVTATDYASLAGTIARFRDAATDAPATSARARRAFVGELGNRVNRQRLGHAVAEAKAVSGERGDDALPADLDAMLSLVRDAYRAARVDAVGERRVSEGGTPPHSVERRRARPAPARAGTYDIAFFWKQNDSGLYGRRSDMIVKHLLASDRVGRVVQFDAPYSIHDTLRCIEPPRGAGPDQSSLTLQTLADRRLGVLDTDRHRARTFVDSPAPHRGLFFGERVASRHTYPAYVREQLASAGLDPARTHAWFCPVVPRASEILADIGFAGVIADLIDDQRGWAEDPLRISALDEQYRKALASADLVFANCQPLADAMSAYAREITVVPNGAERFLDRPMPDRPEGLRGIDGPIAGYVGTLRDRIDWDLLEEVTERLPRIHFVFAGNADGNADAESLGRRDNVHMVGIVPYSDLPAWLRWFDVGLVPHLDNRLTRRMNPLKVYNYFAAGLPIVSTHVANLGVAGDMLQVADDAAGFADAVAHAIDRRPALDSGSWARTMDEISWDSRVEYLLDRMDDCFAPSWAAVG